MINLIFISAKKFEFTPNLIKVKVGEIVTINLENTDFNHGIFISGIQKSGVNSITFMFEEKGIYPFICNNICGIGHSNMDGLIIVD